ncbi:MAG: stage V sporulation protein E, partial [Nitrospira sp.]|nr:stage V sporulation protein E [Nitrospira sp.]
MSRRGAQAVTLTLPWPSSGSSTKTRASADGSLLAVAVVLALVGLVMVFSASAVVAGNRFHDSIYFLKRHLAWLAFGFLMLHAASRLDYTVWRKMALPILGLTVALLILVLVPSLGVVAKGARRWLRLGPISVQPAEMVKLTVVLYMAVYLTRKENR